LQLSKKEKLFDSGGHKDDVTDIDFRPDGKEVNVLLIRGWSVLSFCAWFCGIG